MNAAVRKSAHVFVYGFMGVILYALIPGRKLLYAWGCVAVIAMLDEWHQMYVPGRTPSVMDVVLDSAAALLCMLVVAVWRRNRQRAQKRLSEKS